MSLIGTYGYPVIGPAGYGQLLFDAGVYQDSLEMLQVRLAQDFLNLWAAIPDNADPVRTERYLIERLADMQLAYGSEAASLAAEFLNMSREGKDLPMVVAPPAPEAQVAGTVRWAMSKPATQALLWGAMQRMANQPYRKTIQDSAFAAGNGFARVPDANACGFCLMLASRGAVYYSAQEAREIGLGRYSKKGSRNRRRDIEREAIAAGKRPDLRYHDNCRCSVIEVSRDRGLTEANVYLDDLWAKTFYNDPGPAGDPRFRNELKTNPKTGRKIQPNLRTWEKVLEEEQLPWVSAKQFY